MFHVKEGMSVFDTDANIIVNPVNCFGVMGAGLAKEFKKRFPKNFELYQQQCWNRTMKVGKMFITHNSDIDGLTIYNFPTKDFWKHKSELSYIQKGLEDMLKHLKTGDVVAIPLLGCGLGGLSTSDVVPLMMYYFHKRPDVEVYLCCQHLNSFAFLI